MKRIHYFGAFLLLLVATAPTGAARASGIGAERGDPIRTVYMLLQTNDDEKAFTASGRYEAYVASRLKDAGITSLPAEASADAELKLKLYVHPVKGALGMLGYRDTNRSTYTVYVEVVLERPATLRDGAPGTVMATVWDSAELPPRPDDALRDLPFTTDSRHLSDDIIHALKGMMDAMLEQIAPHRAKGITQANGHT